MWVTIFAWWALLVGGLAMITSLVSRDQHWLVNVRRVTFVTASVAIGIFAFAGAYVPSEVAPLLPLVLVTMAISVATILIVDMRSGRLTWKWSPHHANEDALWRSMARILNDSKTLDELLLAAASVLRRVTGAKMAVVHKTMERTGDVRLVGAAAPDLTATELPLDQADLARLARHGMTDRRLAEYRKSATATVTDRTRWAVVPIRTDERSYATVLLANPATGITLDRNAQTITTFSRLLGHQVASWIAAARNSTQDDLLTRLAQLQTTLAGTSEFEHGLSAIAKCLRGIVPADYLSMAWLDRARFHEDRVSTMLDDWTIIDQRRRWPVWESTTATVLHTNRSIITPNLHELPEETQPTRLYERQLGMRSRVVIPIRTGDRIIGTLTLAHRETTQYGLEETRTLSLFTTSIASWLRQLEHANAEEEYRAALQQAQRVAGLATDQITDREVLEAILQGVDATGLHLYRLDDLEQSLTMVAAVGRLRESEFEIGRSIPLSDTPWHRWAMSERTSYRIDQSDPERLMDQTEAAETMLERMKTGWIVPIQAGAKTIGFLDVMEARDPDRRSVSEPERLVLEAGARVYASRWSEEEVQPASSPDRRTDLVDRVTTLGGTVVNPITGIIGCVELIRQRQQSLSDDTVKYLNMIENSATRIHESVAEVVETTRDVPAAGSPDRATQAVSQRLFGALSLPSRNRETRRYSLVEPIDLTEATGQR